MSPFPAARRTAEGRQRASTLLPACFAARRAAARSVAIAVLLLLGMAVSGPAVAESVEQEPKPAPDTQVDPAAQLPEGGAASEYWDLTIALDSGHRVVARFLVTNVGPGRGNGVAVGFVVAPDGRATKFRNGRQKSGWTLSPDRLRLDVGKCHLHLDAPRQRFWVRKSDVKLDLAFDLGPGATIPFDVTSKDYRIDLLTLGADVEGSLWLEGMAEPADVRGRLTLTHTISQAREADVALRRIELFNDGGPKDLYALDFMDPEGKIETWMAIRDRSTAEPDGEIWTTRRDFHVTVATRGPSLVRGEGKKIYPIPKKLEMGNSTLKGSVLIGDQILRHDPLGDLPQPFRFIVGRRSQPRRVWSQAGIEVTLGAASDREPLQVQGNGVAAVSFLNPLTRP